MIWKTHHSEIRKRYLLVNLRKTLQCCITVQIFCFRRRQKKKNGARLSALSTVDAVQICPWQLSREGENRIIHHFSNCCKKVQKRITLTSFFFFFFKCYHLPTKFILFQPCYLTRKIIIPLLYKIYWLLPVRKLSP